MNKINNKSYIGMTGQNPPSLRWARGSHYKYSQHFYHAIQKYGWDNFEHIIFQDQLTFETACMIERKLILLFNTTNERLGYNLSLGGVGPGKHSEQTKQKIKDNHADFSGANHPMYGRKHTEETKEKIRQKATGRKKSQEEKEKISQRTIGANNPRAKTVLCINNGMIFTTAKAAGEWCGRDFSAICKCCNGKRKTCGIDKETGEKLKWVYI